MKIYVGDNKKTAKKITFQELMISHLRENGFKINVDGFYDENHSWIEIIHETEKPSRVTINLGFDIEEDKLTDIGVWESDIITIVDDENERNIVQIG